MTNCWNRRSPPAGGRPMTKSRCGMSSCASSAGVITRRRFSNAGSTKPECRIAPRSRQCFSSSMPMKDGHRAHRTYADLFRERVDALGETKVQISETALTVRAEDQAHFVVADIDVRVVLLVLRYFSDAVNEIDRFGEVVELERSFDVLLL